MKMKMKIKKFIQYIKESQTQVVSETEIKEFAKEETEKLISDLYERMAEKFPIDSSEINNEDKHKQNKITQQLSELVAQVTINNISVLNNTDTDTDTNTKD